MLRAVRVKFPGSPSKRDEMTIDFCPESHSYKVNGESVPNVTSIISDVMGVGWRADQWYLQRGTAVHHAARLLIEGKLDWSTVDDRILGRIRAVEKILLDFAVFGNGEQLIVERPVASERYHFAGTVDLIVWPTIFDWKGTLDPRAELQIGAYAIGAAETFKTSPKTGIVVEVHDDGSYKCVTYHDLARAKNLFLAALTVYGFKKKHNLKESN